MAVFCYLHEIKIMTLCLLKFVLPLVYLIFLLFLSFNSDFFSTAKVQGCLNMELCFCQKVISFTYFLIIQHTAFFQLFYPLLAL